MGASSIDATTNKKSRISHQYEDSVFKLKRSNERFVTKRDKWIKQMKVDLDKELMEKINQRKESSFYQISEDLNDYESSIWLKDMIENNKLVLYKKVQNSNI